MASRDKQERVGLSPMCFCCECKFEYGMGPAVGVDGAILCGNCRELDEVRTLWRVLHAKRPFTNAKLAEKMRTMANMFEALDPKKDNGRDAGKWLKVFRCMDDLLWHASRQ